MGNNQTVPNTQKNVLRPGKSKRPRLLIVIASGIVALGLVAGLGIFVFGGSSIFTNKSCEGDKQFIQEYNETVRQEGVTKLGQIVEKVQKKQYENDPTCRYVLMVAQYGQQSDAQALETFQKLRALEAQGKHVSGEINDGINKGALEMLIEQQAGQESESHAGQG